jgi:BMFP domain-containing protein YqiC
MINETVEMLARKLAESVPPGLRSFREELEQNFRGVLKAGLGKMDLVTREEFEVQEAVLARTRSKLNGLEERLDSLEKAPSMAKPTKVKLTKAKPTKANSARKKPSKKKSAKKTAKKKSN